MPQLPACKETFGLPACPGSVLVPGESCPGSAGAALPLRDPRRRPCHPVRACPAQRRGHGCQFGRSRGRTTAAAGSAGPPGPGQAWSAPPGEPQDRPAPSEPGRSCWPPRCGAGRRHHDVDGDDLIGADGRFGDRDDLRRRGGGRGEFLRGRCGVLGCRGGQVLRCRCRTPSGPGRGHPQPVPAHLSGRCGQILQGRCGVGRRGHIGRAGTGSSSGITGTSCAAAGAGASTGVSAGAAGASV